MDSSSVATGRKAENMTTDAGIKGGVVVGAGGSSLLTICIFSVKEEQDHHRGVRLWENVRHLRGQENI